VQCPGGAGPRPCGSPASVRWVTQRPRCGPSRAWVGNAPTRSGVTRRSEVRAGVAAGAAIRTAPPPAAATRTKPRPLPRSAFRSIRMRAPHVRNPRWPSLLHRARAPNGGAREHAFAASGNGRVLTAARRGRSGRPGSASCAPRRHSIEGDEQVRAMRRLPVVRRTERERRQAPRAGVVKRHRDAVVGAVMGGLNDAGRPIRAARTPGGNRLLGRSRGAATSPGPASAAGLRRSADRDARWRRRQSAARASGRPADD